MAKGTGKTVLKQCENMFAVCVILACFFTVYNTFNGRGHRVHNVSRSRSVLKFARENFIIAMMRKKNKPESTTTSPDNVDTNVDFTLDDMTDKWFRSRKTEPYETNRKHPIIHNATKLNKNLCGNSSVDILIYIHSLWSNFKRRNVLRETWANTNIFNDITIKTVFILGKPESQKNQMKINNENLAHGDIVQGNFTDSFKNLTMKSILAMKWINDYCSQAKYIVKADDDIFLNIFAAIEYLISQIYEKDYAVMCHLKEADTSLIMRDPNSKWYVPKEVFEGRKHYPRFCSGYAVIFTANLVPLLYKASFDAPYFAVDDAYLFGLLLGKVQDVNYISIQDYMTLNQNSALEEYEGNGPLVHVASAAWEDGAMGKFWGKTLSKLTSWAKEHAKIITNKKTLEKKK